MSLTIAFSSEAKRDLKRLYRRHPSYADELLDMLHDEVRVQGRVPDAYDPHILDNPRAAYSGALEFHFMDDVLVICYPPTPREFLRILHICTHAELKAGRCSENGLVADVQPTSLMTAPLPGDSPCKLFLSFLVSPSPCTQSPACRSRTAHLDEFAQMDNDRYICVLRGLRLFLDYKV